MSTNELSLQGKTIVITRPTHQAQALTTRLQQAGATVIACPLLDIKALAFHLEPTTLQKASLAIFTSPNAVEYFLTSLPNLQVLQHLKIASIGKATTQTLNQYGLSVQYAPSTNFTSEELLALPEFKVLEPQSVLLVKGKGGRTLLAETLMERGMRVILCAVYERIKVPLPTTAIEWASVDWVMITSLEALEHWVISGRDRIPYTIPLLVGSTRIAQAAQQMGFMTIKIAQNPSDNAMWDALHLI